MQFTDEQVKEILERIEVELGKRGIAKYEFYKGSKVSSALYSNWNTKKAKPTRQMLSRIADYLGVSLEFLIYGKEEDEDIDEMFCVLDAVTMPLPQTVTVLYRFRYAIITLFWQ